MNQAAVVAGISIVCMITVTFCGCMGTGPGTPAGVPPSHPMTATPVLAGTIVVTEEQNHATVEVQKGNSIIVRLQENPTTGFSWNLTTSPGLKVVSDTYIPSDTTGRLVGSGGTRVWDITAQSAGRQSVQAVYMRPWEPVTGNETSFFLAVEVV